MEQLKNNLKKILLSKSTTTNPNSSITYGLCETSIEDYFNENTLTITKELRFNDYFYRRNPYFQKVFLEEMIAQLS